MGETTFPSNVIVGFLPSVCALGPFFQWKHHRDAALQIPCCEIFSWHLSWWLGLGDVSTLKIQWEFLGPRFFGHRYNWYDITHQILLLKYLILGLVQTQESDHLFESSSLNSWNSTLPDFPQVSFRYRSTSFSLVLSVWENTNPSIIHATACAFERCWQASARCAEGLVGCWVYDGPFFSEPLANLTTCYKKKWFVKTSRSELRIVQLLPLFSPKPSCLALLFFIIRRCSAPFLDVFFVGHRPENLGCGCLCATQIGGEDTVSLKGA